MLKRFLAFLQQIRNSDKEASKFLLESIYEDTNSITGSNLRNILLMTGKATVWWHIQPEVPSNTWRWNVEGFHPAGINWNKTWKHGNWWLQIQRNRRNVGVFVQILTISVLFPPFLFPVGFTGGFPAKKNVGYPTPYIISLFLSKSCWLKYR